MLAISTIQRDELVHGAVPTLPAESSHPIVKIHNYRQLQASSAAPDGEPSVAAIAEEMQLNRAVWGHTLMNTEDSIERLNAPLAGLAELLVLHTGKLAALCGCPLTLWNGTPPRGMNATGEHGARNWAQTIASRQARIEPQLRKLDAVMARSVGVNEAVLESEFPSILEQSDQEQVALAKERGAVAAGLLQSDIIGPGEARKIVSGDPIIGDLSGQPPDSLRDLYAETDSVDENGNPYEDGSIPAA